MLLGLLLERGLPSALAFDLHARCTDAVNHQNMEVDSEHPLHD